MSNSDNIKNYLFKQVTLLSTKEKWVFVTSTAIFLFLFMIFFQPFGVNNYDPKEAITPLFLTMMVLFSIVTMLAMVISEIIIQPLLLRNPNRIKVILWIVGSVLWLTTIIFLFYNYVGNWHDFKWSSYFEFIGNIGAISLIPLSGILIFNRIKTLRKQLEEINFKVENDGTNLEDVISIVADNGKDKFVIPSQNLIFLESDDNYISIHHLQNEQLTKTLVRQSLKNIDSSNYPTLIRCHRSYIINTLQIESVSGNRNKLIVKLKGMNDPIPVSRQYTESILQLA